MRDFIIAAALAALAGVAGCSSSPSCTIPNGIAFTTSVSGVASSANTCSTDVVTGFEDLSGSTMTFEGSQSCDNLELMFTDPTTSAGCTADGSVAFVFHPPQNDIGTVGSGEGTFDVTCSDGTSCTAVVEMTLTETGD